MFSWVLRSILWWMYGELKGHTVTCNVIIWTQSVKESGGSYFLLLHAYQIALHAVKYQSMWLCTLPQGSISCRNNDFFWSFSNFFSSGESVYWAQKFQPKASRVNCSLSAYFSQFVFESKEPQSKINGKRLLVKIRRKVEQFRLVVE